MAGEAVLQECQAFFDEGGSVGADVVEHASAGGEVGDGGVVGF